MSQWLNYLWFSHYYRQYTLFSWSRMLNVEREVGETFLVGHLGQGEFVDRCFVAATIFDPCS